MSFSPNPLLEGPDNIRVYGTISSVYDPGIDAQHIRWTDPVTQTSDRPQGRARDRAADTAREARPMNEVAERGPEFCCLLETRLGTIGIAWSMAGVTRLQLPERDRAATERRLRVRRGASSASAAGVPDGVGRVIEDIERYASGEPVDFAEAALDLSGVGAFHRTVYDLARRVAWGQTATYGELARQAGAPGAARAVGQAMGRNPVPIIIPCHRVLASGGKIGGFSAFGGALAKERLLALEGVHLAGTPLLPGLLPAKHVASRR